MPQPIPYLAFNGNCAEAMRFYETVLGGKIEFMMKYADSPFAGQCASEHLNRILNARLALDGNGLLLAGDCPPHIPYEGIRGISLMLHYDSVDEAKRVFESLAAGGTITMPMQSTFWAESFGMLTDKFGMDWGVNGKLLPL